MWPLLAAPQNPRNALRLLSPPGSSLWRPRLSPGIKCGGEEGTRLWALPAGQEEVTKLVPKVLWLLSLLGAAGKVLELLRRARSPP